MFVDQNFIYSELEIKLPISNLAKDQIAGYQVKCDRSEPKDAFHEINTLHKIHMVRSTRKRRERKKTQMIAVQFDLFLERSFNC